MISYQPKEWFKFIFTAKRSDTIRQLVPFMVILSLYSLIIAYLELSYWKLSDDNQLKNITVTHSLLGFVLSMLLVFRTNTAYDRWWEGRKLWGSLVNNSRNLAMKMNALLPAEDKKERDFFRKSIPLFAQLLRSHLRSEKTRLELDEQEHPELSGIKSSEHMPNQLAGIMTSRLVRMQQQGKISAEQLLFINNELSSFTDICGACERVKNTPIPYSYSVFVKKFIFFYVMTLPFGYVFSLGYWVVPVVAFIFFVLGSLELIAEEIEEPFGGDANDLPTDKIALGIKKNVEDILI
jgi:ion channel-forming bestrophin family protein